MAKSDAAVDPITPPEWLQKLSENSWQQELFISGGAIFTLLQASDYLIDGSSALKSMVGLPGSDVLLILVIFLIQILTIGFALHLLLRAAWVALICGSYLHPAGIRAERVRWRWPFRPRVPATDQLHAPITHLDRVCTGVIFLALVGTALVAGLILLLIALLVMPSVIKPIAQLLPQPVWDGYFWLVLVMLLAYVFDLAAFGLLRRLPGVAVLVFPAFWLFDRLSLRVLYQSALWQFSTNVSRGRLLIALSVFVLLAASSAYEVLRRPMHWASLIDRRAYAERLAPNPALQYQFYLDELGTEMPKGVHIPSKIITQPLLEVFVVYRAPVDKALLEGRVRYVSEGIGLSIDDSLYQRQAWFPTYKHNSSQLGLTAIIPIQHLAAGAHRLRVFSAVDTSKHVLIPFWTTGG